MGRVPTEFLPAEENFPGVDREPVGAEDES